MPYHFVGVSVNQTSNASAAVRMRVAHRFLIITPSWPTPYLECGAQYSPSKHKAPWSEISQNQGWFLLRQCISLTFRVCKGRPGLNTTTQNRTRLLAIDAESNAPTITQRETPECKRSDQRQNEGTRSTSSRSGSDSSNLGGSGKQWEQRGYAEPARGKGGRRKES